MGKAIQLDEDNYYLADIPFNGDELFSFNGRWTADLPEHGMFKPRYVGGSLVSTDPDEVSIELRGGTWEDAKPLTDAEVNARQKAYLDSQVTAERDRRIAAGVPFNGVVYQSRATDRENIAGAAQLALMATLAGDGAAGNYRWHGGDTDFAWIAADNSLVVMDAPTVIAFAKTAAAVKQAYTLVARGIKDMDPPPTDIKDDALWTLTP